jgi:hypothetical protein
MNCLKCGTEISGEQVFCESCLADMAKHPVKPDTPVLLPTRSKPLPAKRTHRKLYKPEEQVVSQRKLIGWMLALILVLMVAVGILTAATLHYKDAAEHAQQQQVESEIVSRETIFDNL